MKTTIAALLLTFLVTACASAVPVAPGENAMPASTETPAPPVPTVTSTSWPTPLAPSGAFALNRNFPGLGMQNHWVPDPGLAVGDHVIIEATNDSIAIYGKDGKLLAWVYLQDFVSHLRQPYAADAADPRVLYDPESRRFFLFTRATVVDRDCEIGECRAQFFIAASKSEHPTKMTEADWYIYALDATIDITEEGSIPTLGWPDFTTIGVTRDALIVGVIMLDRSGGLSKEDEKILVLGGDLTETALYSDCYERIRVVDKQLLISGGPIETWRDFKVSTCRTHQAALNHEQSPEDLFLVSSQGGTPCPFHILRLEGSAAAPLMTEAQFSTGSCDGVVTVPQPDATTQESSPSLLAGGSITDHPVYVNGSLWIALDVRRAGDPETSAIEFVQVDVSNWPQVEVVQSAVLARPATWYFIPAITVNENNDVAIVFACTDGQQPISICYSGRLGTDPPDTLRPIVTMKAGVLAPISDLCHVADRWGDYFGAVLDPADGSAWIVGQYAKGNCWATWIGNLNWDTVP